MQFLASNESIIVSWQACYPPPHQKVSLFIYKKGSDSERGEKARNSRRVHNSKLRLSVREIRSIN